MEVTEQMIQDFVEAYTIFGDMEEGMEKIAKEMEVADVLLGLEHPEYMMRVHDILVMSTAMIGNLSKMNRLLMKATGAEE